MSKPLLVTHDLSIGYRPVRKTPITIAQALNLELRPGALVGLLGPNGAGKSTLLRTLAGMQPALDGQVLLGGEDVHRLKARALARRLSVVLTERPNLGLMNGYALVALGRHPYTDWAGRLSKHDAAVVRWAIEAVDALDLADHPVMELSDGQRQKLMIARALAQESDLIILDEPTAFLDLPRRVEIMHLLRHLAHSTGRSILLSTHDLDLALRTADALWLLASGQILTGTPEDLVLSGAFEAAFQGEGVHFDRQSGTFHLNRAGGSLVKVNGSGVPHIWTRRALERAGFEIAHNGTPPDATIDVHGSADQLVWHLHRDDQHSQHASLEALLHALHDPDAAGNAQHNGHHD